MQKITLVSIVDIRPHEHIIPENLEKVKDGIKERGFLINPVIIDRVHRIILDGHHRVQALGDLGYNKVPVCAVDYLDENIKVVSRRPEISISKEIIIKHVLAGNIFPFKTSKHTIPGRPMRINVSLDKLI